MIASLAGHAEVVDTLLLDGASTDLQTKVTSCAPMCNKCVQINLYKNYSYIFNYNVIHVLCQNFTLKIKIILPIKFKF